MADPRTPSFPRRAAPIVVVAAGGVALWRALAPTTADSLRLTLGPSTRTQGSAAVEGTTPPTNGSPGSSAAPSTTAAGATNNSTVCAHPVRVTGPTIDTRWGPVQVRAELGTANHVCSAEAIQYPTERQQSAYINSQAVPWINDEVKKQGVNFDFIGGATYTSDGYHQSLQAILDGRHGTTTT